MAVRYKHKCARCRKNYVSVTWREKYPICYDCHKKEMVGEIEDPKIKKLLNISEDLYKESMFLRNIKIAYLRYKNLTERQIEAFEKVVTKLKEKKEKL